MKKFSDFNIVIQTEALIGDKIKIERVLNKAITVEKFKIEDSKFEKKGSGKCLHLQITMNGERHVVFTGSNCLIQAIKQVPCTDLPFTTIIEKRDGRLQFT